jgi:hypothetical protein
MGMVVLLALVGGCRSATPAGTSPTLVGTSWIAEDFDGTRPALSGGMNGTFEGR